MTSSAYLCTMANPQDHIFSIRSEEKFLALALETFRFQSGNNPVYSGFLDLLGVNPEQVREISQIPFLPIEFFRTHRVISSSSDPAIVFESSGTSGQQNSRHCVVSEELYRESFTRAFTAAYGKPEERCILALLPSYLERGNASLVYMMDHLIRMSNHAQSGFYLDDLEGLSTVLEQRNNDGHPTLLMGVSFALLDLAAAFTLPLSENIIVMETGGMKGRRREMIREELHTTLKKAFSMKTIHSEYGMTELLSQAYSKGDGRFTCPPWMKVWTRDPYDPLTLMPPGRSGGINIIDLANTWSCSFIATGDTGRVFSDGSFEITGRFDQAEVRGCNLMVL